MLELKRYWDQSMSSRRVSKAVACQAREWRGRGGVKIRSSSSGMTKLHGRETRLHLRLETPTHTSDAFA